MEFFQIYRPITANPFQSDDSYREYEPCEALKPYIRCFWGNRRPYWEEQGDYGVSTVIPDTCMDIIFDVNFTDNYINSSFCGINDSSFHSHRKVEKSCVYICHSFLSVERSIFCGRIHARGQEQIFRCRQPLFIYPKGNSALIV